MSEVSWNFKEGDEIVPGRSAVRLLGGGGYRYEAYLAWDDHLLSLVVAKVVRPDQVRDVRTLEGLVAEARMLERLSHPVLLRSFGAVLDGERPHLVLEFLEGPRLSTLIRRYGPVALEQLLPLGIQLASALHYLHEERVLHLDVKPRNTIMGAPPRLIDLSIAKSLEERDAIVNPVGTDAYMAPEQCAPADGEIGPPADVWGLGVTLYEAIVGKRPFSDPPQDARGRDRFPQLVEEPAPIDGDVPDALTKPILACLERRPGDRPIVRELAGSLEELLAYLPSRPLIGRLRPR